MSGVMSKISGFFVVVIVLVIIIFGFLFFEPFLTEKVETITVINKEKWAGERRSYFIFTEKEVFVNIDNHYHNKENADKLYQILKPGYSYKVKVVGMSIPFLTRFRNIIEILDDKEINVPLPNPTKK